MKHIFGGFLFAAALLFGNHAFAQAAPPQPLPSSVLCDTCEKAVSVTNASLATINPSTSPPFNTLTIYNAGSKDVYIKQGDSSVVATTSNIRIPASSAVQLWVSGTYVAAITGGSDTTTLYEYQSNGPIELRLPAGSGGGGGGTVDQGSPNGGGASSWWVQLYNSLVGVKGADGSAIASAANAFPVQPGTGANFKTNIDQTTPGTTNGVVVNSGTLTTLTNPAGIKGADGSSITSASNPFPTVQGASTPVTATLQSGATANGNGTVINVSGMSSVLLTVNCSACSGGTTVNFEGTEDGTNYSSMSATQLGTATIATTTTTSGVTLWQMPVAGLVSIRARISAYSAGTVTITGHTVPVDWNSRVNNANVVNTPAVTCAACSTAALQPSNSAQGATTSGQTGTLGMMATTTSPPTDTATQTNPLHGDTHGGVRMLCQDANGTVCDFTKTTQVTLTSQYPYGSTPITGNATGTTGSVVGTLAGTAGKTTYICGMTISATGGVATIGPIVVAGLTGSSQNYQLFSSATGANLPNPFAGSVCVPASATNTAITITTTADATATAVDVNSWGYQL